MTTNGSTPTTSSQQTATVNVTATQTVKAICAGDGYVASKMATETYTIVPLSPPSGAVGSSGCGKTVSPANPASTPSPPLAAFNIGGLQRTFLYVVTPNYDRNQPSPLIFSFHGNGGSSWQSYGYKIHDEAIAKGQSAIFIYPDGAQYPDGFGWDESSTSNDVKYFDALVAWAKSNFCIDENRIFVSGFSWGCDFSNALGCYRGDKIRAINCFSGIAAGRNCTAQAPAYRVTYSSGTKADGTTNPEVSTDFSYYTWDRIYAAIQRYATANSCGTLAAAEKNPVSPGSCLGFTGCSKPVIFCPYPNMSHTLPADGGKDAWTFFSTFQ